MNSQDNTYNSSYGRGAVTDHSASASTHRALSNKRRAKKVNEMMNVSMMYCNQGAALDRIIFRKWNARRFKTAPYSYATDKANLSDFLVQKTMEHSARYERIIRESARPITYDNNKFMVMEEIAIISKRELLFDHSSRRGRMSSPEHPP